MNPGQAPIAERDEGAVHPALFWGVMVAAVVAAFLAGAVLTLLATGSPPAKESEPGGGAEGVRTVTVVQRIKPDFPILEISRDEFTRAMGQLGYRLEWEKIDYHQYPAAAATLLRDKVRVECAGEGDGIWRLETTVQLDPSADVYEAARVVAVLRDMLRAVRPDWKQGSVWLTTAIQTAPEGQNVTVELDEVEIAFRKHKGARVLSVAPLRDFYLRAMADTGANQ